MRILIFHGYLLHGTGSNVYNAELAAALVRLGHEVHLLCQDRDPLGCDWVDAHGDWDTGALNIEVRNSPARATVYRPNIGSVLPVYVADRYEGIEARAFPELTEDEVSYYVDANVNAVREVAERVSPDVALANHLVMGPVILARALRETGVPYAVKIHGSALEYTVKPHPRFHPYAREGLKDARGVLVGSRHTAESLWEAMDADAALRNATRLGPPGVDLHSFLPRDPAEASDALRGLTERLARETKSSSGTAVTTFMRDAQAGSVALAEVDPTSDRTVIYVGKLIASKGVELLLAAWPLVANKVPNARLLVVGFGAFREGLEQLVSLLVEGDLDAAREIVGENGQELTYLANFLDALSTEPQILAAYKKSAASLEDRISWVGRLNHDELVELLPFCESIVVPSTFPESFGMVAAEGAACGAFPIVANHSGLGEVARVLSPRVPDEIRAALLFDLTPRAVFDLAHSIVTWLTAPEDVREIARQGIIAETTERYSWEGVARGVIAAARGEFDTLPTP